MKEAGQSIYYIITQQLGLNVNTIEYKKKYAACNLKGIEVRNMD